MRISDYDYELPEELIALEPRDASRLLVVPADGPLAHRANADLPEIFAPGGLLVLNELPFQ
jgi:S-adenosylmethionine:tRNA ribosyltransferase-isomerase